MRLARLSCTVGTTLVASLALAVLPTAAGAPSLGLGQGTGVVAQGTGCVPVSAAVKT